MNSIFDSDALISFVFSIGLALVGFHLKNEYRRLFVDSSRDEGTNELMKPFAGYLGYIASFFFTGALLFFASSAYSIIMQLWRNFG